MTSLHPRLRWVAGSLLSQLALVSACAAPSPDAPNAPRLVPSADGTEVINTRARLAWSRCVEGMSWNGQTCTGKPKLVDHAGAMGLAAARRQSEALGWRLPRVTELKRLVSKGVTPPGVDPVLFPAAPRGWYWSMTANLRTGGNFNQYNYGNVMRGRTSDDGQPPALQGWAVNLSDGEARDDVSKQSRLPVRLVRPLP